MTKFENPKFTEYYGSKKYCEGWDRIFGSEGGEEEPEVVVEDNKNEDGHYKTCNTNYGGSCDCGIIDQVDPDSKENCSNCTISGDESKEFPGKLLCGITGSHFPAGFKCKHHKPMREEE